MDPIKNFLTKEYGIHEFDDSYTDWSEILTKIEQHFVIRTVETKLFKNWKSRIKDKQYIRTISMLDLTQELKKLEPETKYWIVLDLYDNPNEKHEVYGCTLSSLTKVISAFTTGLKTNQNETYFYVGKCFFLVDNKYRWFSVFEVDQDKKEIVVFKSGSKSTPFDN